VQPAKQRFESMFLPMEKQHLRKTRGRKTRISVAFDEADKIFDELFNNTLDNFVLNNSLFILF